jgi:hypothetical protein
LPKVGPSSRQTADARVNETMRQAPRAEYWPLSAEGADANTAG